MTTKLYFTHDDDPEDEAPDEAVSRALQEITVEIPSDKAVLNLPAPPPKEDEIHLPKREFAALDTAKIAGMASLVMTSGAYIKLPVPKAGGSRKKAKGLLKAERVSRDWLFTLTQREFFILADWSRSDVHRRVGASFTPKTVDAWLSGQEDMPDLVRRLLTAELLLERAQRRKVVHRDVIEKVSERVEKKEKPAKGKGKPKTARALGEEISSPNMECYRLRAASTMNGVRHLSMDDALRIVNQIARYERIHQVRFRAVRREKGLPFNVDNYEIVPW